MLLQCTLAHWMAVQCTEVRCTEVQCTVVQCTEVQCTVVQCTEVLCEDLPGVKKNKKKSFEFSDPIQGKVFTFTYFYNFTQFNIKPMILLKHVFVQCKKQLSLKCSVQGLMLKEAG